MSYERGDQSSSMPELKVGRATIGHSDNVEHSGQHSNCNPAQLSDIEKVRERPKRLKPALGWN